MKPCLLTLENWKMPLLHWFVFQTPHFYWYFFQLTKPRKVSLLDSFLNSIGVTCSTLCHTYWSWSQWSLQLPFNAGLSTILWFLVPINSLLQTTEKRWGKTQGTPYTSYICTYFGSARPFPLVIMFLIKNVKIRGICKTKEAASCPGWPSSCSKPGSQRHRPEQGRGPACSADYSNSVKS